MSRGIFQAGFLLAISSLSMAAWAHHPTSASCAKPGSPAVKKICADPALVTLNDEIEHAYEAAVTVVGHAGRAALKRDQDAYIVARDEAVAKGDDVLGPRLMLRRDFLASIRGTNGTWSGSWGNAFATIDIQPKQAGTFNIRLHATDPTAGRWVCEFEDTGILARSVMIVGAESATEVAGGPNEGWTLAFRLAGDILLVEPLRPRGHTGAMPFCGKGGNVAGNYFALHAKPATETVIDPE